MNTAQRRSFLCLAASAISSLPYLNSFALTADWSDFALSRSDVEVGLSRGLEFREQDEEVLAFLSRFSDRQVMIGGGVLTFAAKQPTEWIHLLVRIDSLEEFSATMNDREIPWAMANASHGNTLAFEYKDQHYYVETLVEEEFLKRLARLKKPGSEVNGFRLEFAHDAVLYDLQKKRHLDPFDAIGRGNQVELKRIAPENGIPSAIRILVEENSLGIEIPRKEKEFAEKTIQGRYAKRKESQEDAIQLLSGVSRLAEHADPSVVRDVLTSDLSEEAVEEHLGEDVRRFASLRNSLEGAVDEKTGEGALWHLSMRCLEDTDTPECEVEAELTLSELGGYDDFFTRRDLAMTARELSENERVKRERAKQAELDRKHRAAQSAPSAGGTLSPNSNRHSSLGTPSFTDSAKGNPKKRSNAVNANGVPTLGSPDLGPFLSPLPDRSKQRKTPVPAPLRVRRISGN